MRMLAIFGALAAFFFVLERLMPRRPQPVVRRGWTADLFYIPVHYFLRVAVSFLLADLATRAGSALLPGLPLLAGQPLWVEALAVILILDFAFYVTHVLKHRWHWWWRLHETHHSSEEMDFLSSVRFHPLEKLLDRLIYLLPLTVLGASQTALLIWSAVDVFCGMMNHSNTRLRLGPLRYVFVEPSMHLWHHVKDPARRDCNFGNNLSIFDWLFGTAYVTREEPRDFGVEEAAYPHDNIAKQFVFAFRDRDTSPGG